MVLISKKIFFFDKEQKSCFLVFEIVTILTMISCFCAVTEDIFVKQIKKI